ncbi:MAG: N-acetyltransferase, partial [Alphaproteobacteria bacterium]|nr:N-acetyltransferase [Alphaproteobacteria bacterium]
MLSFRIVPEDPAHADAVEHLCAEAFGPGRFAKTAQRLRERNHPVDGLSFVALNEASGEPIGSIRFWPVRIGADPALLLGPLAVVPSLRGQGTGIALMRRGLDEAQAQGHRLVILVGDAPYYARVGFVPVPEGQILLPGPVQPGRLLGHELVPGALGAAAGPVRAAP